MRTALLLILIIALNIFLGWVTNLPQEVGDDVPEGKLNSISYAPFREGQSPLEAKFPSVEQIESDLKLLADKTHSIRIYASGEGTMKSVPGLAQKYGLKLIQGAWLGYMEVDNRKEIESLIWAANNYPDVVKRVIVGNEILLRGEMEPEELVKYIREVKSKVKQPVSYADVWSMYMKYPELIKEVDFITIHILPYWEDEPIPVDKAPAHIERIYRQVQKEAEAIAPGKAILIGESGWPSAGKQRGWAVPSVINEAKFIRGLIKVAQQNSFDYNIVEAFNQPWKSELEGIVGGNWGLFSVARKQVFPLTGKVQEHTDWLNLSIYASTLMAMMTILFRKKLRHLPTFHLTALLLFGQLLCYLLVTQTNKSWYTSYTDWQRLQVLGTTVVNVMLALLVLYRARSLLLHKSIKQTYAIAMKGILSLISFIGIYMTAQLALNGRYLSFPFTLVGIAVAGIIGLIAIYWLSSRRLSFQVTEVDNLLGLTGNKHGLDSYLGYGLLLIGLLLITGEIKAFLIGRDFVLAYPDINTRVYWATQFTITNRQLLQWLFCLVVLGLPWLAGKNRKPTKPN